MAGFGGFGSTSNNTNNPFGAPPAGGPFGGGAPAPALSGGSFGTAFASPAPVFGNSPPSNPPMAGFGSNPFGATQQPQQAATPPASSNPFNGTAAPGFGNNNAAAPSNPFAGGSFSSPAPTASSFGNAATAPSWQPTASTPFGNTGNGAPSNNPFGTTADSASTNPFQAPPATGPPAMTPFGPSQNSASTSMSTFGGPFASQHSASNDNHPFANGMDSDMDGGGGGDAPAGRRSGPSSQGHPNSNPFSQSASGATSSPFGQAASSSSAPFGSSTSAFAGSNPFGSPAEQSKASKPPRSDLPFGTPQPNTGGGSMFPPPPALARNNEAGQNDDETKKRLALIEKKKKRLEELKRKKAAAWARGDTPPASSLNADVAPFVPAETTPPTEDLPKSDTATDTSSLAERNAARFDSTASNAATRAHLPSDLQAKAGQAVDYSALRSAGGADRGVLGQAKSLVGTCPHMCPDEELLRREREGDIQLLELVRPGELHPADWTLRNTAIKRFRRSAADYKLDVPEWVRPPDVLENVCGYLEEWVMERDRQGGDPRFKGKTPPPLDVYQFIWNRTRMIRKDFTLQNYVGTGGNCDARAVRCHERIARWHAMCEHQLSHINDFVVMQSQQNIQELGQTMKTLNQFYDDALKRSRIEVPDDAGNETRTDLAAYAHGCANETIQGKTPSDYDDVEMVNSPMGSRLVGKEGIQKFHHGTAEPEMRGLYILLTIDNDGGMEVMRYAAHLSRERPEIFQSWPVQLALGIYKAKKESNYARFFRILRSSSTPYLFGCIMFKYVPQMRKVAFEIMSKTFGGKNRDTNETLYDAYQLKDLIRTLCFEDEEEALAACRHYNITVKEMKVKSSSGTVSVAQMVFWRATDFAEPKDPDKGFPIPLRPKKMVSTIETKRQGATRLAVCRGDVSGNGAFLSGGSAAQNVNFDELLKKQKMALVAMRKNQDGKAAAAQEAEKKRLEEEERKKKEEDFREQERRKKEEERIQREKIAEAERLEKERKIAHAKALEEELQRKKEQERLEREREKAEEERLRKLEEERKRKEKEEAERERQRVLEEQRKEAERRKAEEERKKKQAELERLRKEEEARQRELARKMEAERKAKEEEERRLAKVWNEKISRARKILILNRWRKKMPNRIEMYEESKESLARLKEFSVPSNVLPSSAGFGRTIRRVASSTFNGGLRSVVDGLLKDTERFRVDFDCVRSLPDNQEVTSLGKVQVFLIKVAVFFPESNDERYTNLCALVHRFASTSLGLGSVHYVPSVQTERETRIVFVDGNSHNNRDSCDGVLIVVPSGDSGIPSDALENFSMLANNVPRAAVLLSENVDTDDECYAIHRALTENSDEAPLMRNTALSKESVSNSLLSGVESILHEIAKHSLPTIDRIPVDRIAMLCLNKVLWLDGILDSRDGLLESAKDALAVLVDELDSFGKTGKEEWNWPSREFFSSGSGVTDYFGKGLELPQNWQDSLLRENVAPFVQELAFRLNGSFPHVISKLLAEATEEVQHECRELFELRSFRRCLQRALMWRDENQEPWQSTQYVYLPSTLVERVIVRTVEAVEPPLTSLVENSWNDDDIEQPETPSEVVPAPVMTPPPNPPEDTDEEPPEPIMDAPPSRKRVSATSEQQKWRRPSKRLRESREFTRRLEALASGRAVPPVMVGGRPLSVLLRGAPPPMDPATFRAKQRPPVEEIL